MPRRPPGEIRLERPRGVPRWRLAAVRRRPPVIPGLSPSASRQIAGSERARGIPAGSVARAFRRWGRADRPGRGAPSPAYWHCDPDSPDGYAHVRGLLEGAARALRPRARRELRRQLEPLDDRVIARTVNDPFAHRDLPWWLRRIET